MSAYTKPNAVPSLTSRAGGSSRCLKISLADDFRALRSGAVDRRA